MSVVACASTRICITGTRTSKQRLSLKSRARVEMIIRIENSTGPLTSVDKLPCQRLHNTCLSKLYPLLNRLMVRNCTRFHFFEIARGAVRTISTLSRLVNLVSSSLFTAVNVFMVLLLAVRWPVFGYVT